jgi:hypothetical protein
VVARLACRSAKRRTIFDPEIATMGIAQRREEHNGSLKVCARSNHYVNVYRWFTWQTWH